MKYMTCCVVFFAVPVSVININFRFSVTKDLEEINSDVVASSLVYLETKVCTKLSSLSLCIAVPLCAFLFHYFTAVGCHPTV